MRIIAHAKKEVIEGKRPSKKSERKNFPNQYFEFHHILPRSLFPLWAKRKSNIVALSAREHFFCHKLLAKIYQDSCMVLALHWLCNGKQKQHYKISSREYAKIKQSVALVLRNRYKGKSRNKGLYATFSEKKKQKIKEKMRATRIANGTSFAKENNPMYGKHWKDHPEWKRCDRTGKNNPNYGNHKLAGKNNPMYGKNVKDFMSPEAYKNMCKKRGQKTAIRLLKKVMCIEDNRIMNSCSETCKIYNIPMSTLSRIIRKNTDCQACPGKHFKFV